MARYRTLATAATLMFSMLCAAIGYAQMSDKYQPNAESKKYPEGSALERKARMAAIATNPAYTRKFDLSALSAATLRQQLHRRFTPRWLVEGCLQ
jgi:phosphate transport system substrate-binding protein